MIEQEPGLGEPLEASDATPAEPEPDDDAIWRHLSELAGNGEIERLMQYITDTETKWDDIRPFILKAYRSRLEDIN